MSFDPVLLARIQFAANISFHILFPTITIALGWLLLYFKLRYRRSGDAAWMALYGFFVKVFALSFALGVVSGVTMSFQFGTNWPGYMMKVGNVAGPLLAYEVLTAFFLEASFLGIMLFGRQKVGERLHTLATFLVAAGTTASAFWILALNSWMQTPAGVEWVDGQAIVLDWWKVVFNPSFPYRFVHVLLASGLTCAFLVAGLSAYRWLKADRSRDVRFGLRTGIGAAALLIPLQIFVGDLHGLNTLQHQPAKVAAMEGIWHDERGAPALLFAWPNEAEQRNDYAVGIPKLASLILTHELDGELKGLSSFPDQTPPVAPVFFSFRIMVGVGMLMLASAWAAAFLMWRRRHTPGAAPLPPWLMKLLVWMSFSGWVATLAGWYVTEVGRQPYLVYGMLRTSEAASSVPAGSIALSLLLYLILYAGLLIAYISVLFHLAGKQAKSGLEQSGNSDKEVVYG